MKTTVKMNFEELENVSGGRCMIKPLLQNTMQNEIVFEAQSNMVFKKL